MKLPKFYTIHALPIGDTDKEGEAALHIASGACWCHPLQISGHQWTHNALDCREKYERQTNQVHDGRGWHNVLEITPLDRLQNLLVAGELTSAEAFRHSESTAERHGSFFETQPGPLTCFLDEWQGWAAILFLCPACEATHLVPVTGPHAYGWNGSLVAPSLRVPVESSKRSKGTTCLLELRDGIVHVDPLASEHAGESLPLAHFHPHRS